MIESTRSGLVGRLIASKVMLGSTSVLLKVSLDLKIGVVGLLDGNTCKPTTLISLPATSRNMSPTGGKGALTQCYHSCFSKPFLSNLFLYVQLLFILGQSRLLHAMTKESTRPGRWPL